MAQLKPVTVNGMLKDINDNFAALGPVGSFAGLRQRRTAVAVLEVDEEAGLEPEAYALDVKLPANSIVVGALVDVLETFTSDTDAATIAISLGESAVVSAVAISNAANPWDQGLHLVTVNTPIKVADETPITVSVAQEALTGGKMVVYLDYYEGIETETEE